MADQTGRVFLITGGSTGIGYKVAKTLYHLNGRVYITASTLGSVEKAVNSIHESSPHPSQTVKSGKGSIRCLLLNLSDLSTIKSSAQEFLSKESRPDVVWHNAGVMIPDDGDVSTAQGYHQQPGVNALAPFLFQHFLIPLMLSTAALPSTPRNSVPRNICFVLRASCISNARWSLVG